ncbi:fibrillin-3-like [Dendronephthya gigantea]|uniref:fibrillin-3-like n=1 Tax=Dendronephthya gigantea TaxID=151771 RepID=UPI00106CF113|nr:fibrillin-3-like [Dendronephthya gigantea]
MGYEGNGYNCTDVDECRLGNHTCHSQATCRNTNGSFTCTCNEGYTGNGTTCEDINECVAAPRKCSGAGQECFNFPGAFRCNCFSPRQQIIDGECTDIQASVEGQFVIINRVYKPAYNDTQSLEYYEITQLLIIELTNLYTRTARLRFTFQSIIILRLFPGSVGFDYVATFNDSAGINNENIQEELVESMNVTQNGTFLGADFQISESTNLTEVKDQFSVKDYDECNPQNSIHTPDCGNNALCRNTNTSYECICLSGYEKNNTGCNDVDECALRKDNCDNQATCKNTNGSFTCLCNEGYTGNGTTCEDVNECALGTHNCDSKATCSNTTGSFICTCNDGYTGNGTACEDVDECSVGTHNCHSQATCNDTTGSFSCTCNEGYTGNGIMCEDVDECALGTDNCDNQATCKNTTGSFTCTCNEGYTGDGTTCKDVDECALGSDNCDKHATCKNTTGSFTCTCNEGYTGDGTTCKDVDECTVGAHNCHSQATCSNTTGSFNCTCNKGYKGNGTMCEDVDECISGTHNCHSQATCKNTTGSFTCTCNQGYTGDGTTCKDVDECTGGAHNCHSQATCSNTTGSFTCTCNEGYSGNGTMCEDVDECISGTHNCHSQATCKNTAGSFNCTCNEGYTGNGTTCEDINECVGASRKCSGQGQECVNFPGAYRCHCTSPRQQIINEECTDIQASVEGRFVIINRVYKPAYNDTQSLEYFQFTELLLIELTNLYTRTPRLRFTFQKCIILRLFRGSVGFDYVATFNDPAGINGDNIKQQLVDSMNVTQNGTFLGADLKISNSTDRTEVKGLFSVKDYDECNLQNSIHTPDCGNNSLCMNTNTSYECVCLSGYEKSNGSCLVAIAVDKDDVNIVRNLTIAVILWSTLCFTIAIILVLIAGFSMCSEMYGEKHHSQFETELQSMPETVTSPVYTTYPAMEHYYAGNE